MTKHKHLKDRFCAKLLPNQTQSKYHTTRHTPTWNHIPHTNTSYTFLSMLWISLIPTFLQTMVQHIQRPFMPLIQLPQWRHQTLLLNCPAKSPHRHTLNNITLCPMVLPGERGWLPETEHCEGPIKTDGNPWAGSIITYCPNFWKPDEENLIIHHFCCFLYSMPGISCNFC